MSLLECEWVALDVGIGDFLLLTCPVFLKENKKENKQTTKTKENARKFLSSTHQISSLWSQ